MQSRSAGPIDEEDDAYPDDLYDMYQGSRGSGGSRQQTRSRQQPRYIEEEDDASDYEGSFDEGDFEMMTGRRGTSMSSRSASRRIDVRKIRVKVHAEDVRYIMIGTAIEFPDFVDRIRDKFGLRRKFKIKVRDEDVPDGDKITMGDQDDLDMVVMSAKSQARRQRQEIGKLEVSRAESLPIMRVQITNNRRFGFMKFRFTHTYIPHNASMAFVCKQQHIMT